MCWISKELKPLTSDGNVKVFKVCKFKKNTLCGYWYDSFKYKLNKEYQTKITIEFNLLHDFYEGTTGFHSYDASLCKVKLRNYVGIILLVYKCGENYVDKLNFPSYSLSLLSETTSCLVEGYIPKGAQYHVNEYGEIISNKLVLEKIIPIESIENSELYLKQ